MPDSPIDRAVWHDRNDPPSVSGGSGGRAGRVPAAGGVRNATAPSWPGSLARSWGSVMSRDASVSAGPGDAAPAKLTGGARVTGSGGTTAAGVQEGSRSIALSDGTRVTFRAIEPVAELEPA